MCKSWLFWRETGGLCVGFAIIRQTTKITHTKKTKRKFRRHTHFIAKYTFVRTQLLAGGSSSATRYMHVSFFSCGSLFCRKGFAPLGWMKFGCFHCRTQSVYTLCSNYWAGIFTSLRYIEDALLSAYLTDSLSLSVCVLCTKLHIWNTCCKHILRSASNNNKSGHNTQFHWINMAMVMKWDEMVPAYAHIRMMCACRQNSLNATLAPVTTSQTRQNHDRELETEKASLCVVSSWARFILGFLWWCLIKLRKVYVWNNFMIVVLCEEKENQLKQISLEARNH